jgi:hypothetical protein
MERTVGGVIELSIEPDAEQEGQRASGDTVRLPESFKPMPQEGPLSQEEVTRRSLEELGTPSRSPADKPWVYDHRNEKCNRIPDDKLDAVLEKIEHEHGPCEEAGDGSSAILWCEHGVKVALGKTQNDCRKARLALEQFLEANGQCKRKPGGVRCEN